MSKLYEFVDKAQHNEELAKVLSTTHKGQYTDWEITILFYAALHYINALFVACNATIHKSHIKRSEALESLLEQNKISQTLIDAYNEMSTASRNSRYEHLVTNTVLRSRLMEVNCKKQRELLTEIKQFVHNIINNSKGIV
jgi:hypothetical protein